MNQEQVKSAVRWVITSVGSFLLGLAVTKKWVTADQVQSILSSEFFLGIISMVGALVWGLVAKTLPNLIKTTESLGVVEGVVLKPTKEATEVAAAIPTDKVAVAGTIEAKKIAA